MKRFLSAFAATVISVSSAVAAPSSTRISERPDHLVPESSVLGGNEALLFQDYYNLIYHILSDGFDRDVEVRAVVLPSFSPEYLVGIRGAAPGQMPNYHVFYLRPKVSLWGYQSLQSLENGLTEMKTKGADETLIKAQTAEIARLKTFLPPRAEDITLEHCERSMDVVLARQVKKVWVRTLQQTHYPTQSNIGFDGVSFHFSAWNEYQPLEGQTWSPDPTSKPGMLADLAEALVGFCDGKVQAGSVEHQVDALTKRLAP